jgi:activator of HSP90 ATPase
MSKNVILAATFPTVASRLYDMYLDQRAHAEFTGAPVTIEARRGAPFSAYDGMLSGMMLHFEPKRLIVQTWRSANWPSEAIDSVLTLSFHDQGDTARIELVHVNIPDVDFAGVSEGWVNYYWKPWRDYLST